MIRTPLVLDASIILNMLSVNSLETLLAVEREFCTTDFVLNSIKKTICKGTFAKLEKSQKLKIYSIDKDVEKFFEFHSSLRNLLTIEGCSVLFHAKKTNATLLSSDRNLLDVAKKNDIRSFDLLDVLECMIKKNILSKKEAVENLTTLMEENRILLKEECEKRIVRWEN
ncbi:hypothetical protein BGX14_0531 [Fibrobacter sp. UWS1]|nr:hypothetical protein BGX14_0531 [Fibrobacter sp. UWS1]